VFAFSFGKLLLLALVLAGLWLAFRVIGRKRRLPDRGRRGGTRIAAEDMTGCPRCGVYVSARRAAPCARTDCPYR